VTRRAVFIAGAHTDVGKTHVACALIRAARARGLTVDALKPAASGFDPADWTGSDPGRLLAALGRPLDTAELDRITPWRFTAALAPPMAAALEGRPLRLAPMIDFCAARLADADADLLLIEGVGGLMSPIAEAATGLDLMDALDLPTLLVGGSYLGAISHTLTALAVLRGRGHPVPAVMLSQDADPAAPDFKVTTSTLAALAGGTPVLAAARGGAQDWAQAALDLLA